MSHPNPSLPRDDAAKKYVRDVVTEAEFPPDGGAWEADIETAYQQGWEDAIAWYQAQSSVVGKPAEGVK